MQKKYFFYCFHKYRQKVNQLPSPHQTKKIQPPIKTKVNRQTDILRSDIYIYICRQKDILRTFWLSDCDLQSTISVMSVRNDNGLERTDLTKVNQEHENHNKTILEKTKKNTEFELFLLIFNHKWYKLLKNVILKHFWSI